MPRRKSRKRYPGAEKAIKSVFKNNLALTLEDMIRLTHYSRDTLGRAKSEMVRRGELSLVARTGKEKRRGAKEFFSLSENKERAFLDLIRKPRPGQEISIGFMIEHLIKQGEEMLTSTSVAEEIGVKSTAAKAALEHLTGKKKLIFVGTRYIRGRPEKVYAVPEKVKQVKRELSDIDPLERTLKIARRKGWITEKDLSKSFKGSPDFRFNYLRRLEREEKLEKLEIEDTLVTLKGGTSSVWIIPRKKDKVLRELAREKRLSVPSFILFKVREKGKVTSMDVVRGTGILPRRARIQLWELTQKGTLVKISPSKKNLEGVWALKRRDRMEISLKDAVLPKATKIAFDLCRKKGKADIDEIKALLWTEYGIGLEKGEDKELARMLREKGAKVI